jgi:hypothetical protein
MRWPCVTKAASSLQRYSGDTPKATKNRATML